MKIRSFALGALVLAAFVPAAIAAQDDNAIYRDKPNNGGVSATMEGSQADVAAFAVFDDNVAGSTLTFNDYWPGKSDNGYNK